MLSFFAPIPESEAEDFERHFTYPFDIEFTFTTELNDQNPICDKIQVLCVETAMNAINYLRELEQAFENNASSLELILSQVIEVPPKTKKFTSADALEKYLLDEGLIEATLEHLFCAIL